MWGEHSFFLSVLLLVFGLKFYWLLSLFNGQYLICVDFQVCFKSLGVSFGCTIRVFPSRSWHVTLTAFVGRQLTFSTGERE